MRRDPARLALWSAGEKKRHDDWVERTDAGGAIFAVSGCDHEVLYSCFHPYNHGTYYGLAVCTELHPKH